MKRKILLTAIAITATVTLTLAGNLTPSDDEGTNGYGSQQVVVVKNYYNQNGYEYTSRIKRFHTTYVTFDFYSPLFTETYWYRYTPYTWGVSIYDDWSYYGSGVSRYSWRNSFGGSYWWGYDAWRDYNPWMGYSWNSWYSPGVSYSVNFYLGRPNYHYPMAWNRWNNYSSRNYSRPVNIINHNTYNYYYGSEKRNSYQNNSSGYNPSHPYGSDRRSGYTATGGRSSASRTAPPSSSGSQAGARATGRTDNAGEGTNGHSVTTQSDDNRDKSNNGLRMGQYRRGVADPVRTDDNNLPRTNNPNVNDRTDPGREQGNTTRTVNRRQNAVTTGRSRQQVTTTQGTNRSATQVTTTQGNNRSATQVTTTQGVNQDTRRVTTTPGSAREQGTPAQTTNGQQKSVDRTPAKTTTQRRQTQGSVKTITRRQKKVTNKDSSTVTSSIEE